MTVKIDLRGSTSKAKITDVIADIDKEYKVKMSVADKVLPTIEEKRQK